MEDGGKSNALQMILGFIIVIAMGVGGYFLGKTMDTAELEKQAAADAAANALVGSYYESAATGIKFDLPSSTWEVTEDIVDDDDYGSITSIGVVSTTGSSLIYSLYKEKGDTDGSYYRCTPDDADGELPGNEACTFFDGDNAKYGRFIKTEDGDNGVEWIITEYDEETDAYWAYPYDGFSYFAVESSDLKNLDNIMKSMER